jgi:hypothetical protein
MSFRIVNAAAGLALLAPLAVSAAPAEAGGVSTFNCVGTRGSVSCVETHRHGSGNPYIIQVPQPISDEDRAAAAAREKRWVERCQPLILQDRYGVPRYDYAAPGCEYGRLD